MFRYTRLQPRHKDAFGVAEGGESILVALPRNDKPRGNLSSKYSDSQVAVRWILMIDSAPSPTPLPTLCAFSKPLYSPQRSHQGIKAYQSNYRRWGIYCTAT